MELTLVEVTPTPPKEVHIVLTMDEAAVLKRALFSHVPGGYHKDMGDLLEALHVNGVPLAPKRPSR